MQSLVRFLGPSRSFRALLVAALSDDLAKGIATFLLPIAAIALTTSPIHVAAVTVMLTLPWLVVGPVSGLLVDRLDRRMVLTGAEFARATALLTLVAAMLAGWESLPLLYAVALVIGTTETLIEPALVAAIPAVTPRGQLDAANARVVGGRTVTDNLAQALSGALVSVGMALAAFSAAVGFVIAGLGYTRMRGRFVRAAVGSGRAASTGFRQGIRIVATEIAEGMRTLLAGEPLRTIAIASAVINGCWAAWWSVWALRVLSPGPVGLTPFALGLLMSVGVVAAMVGAAVALPIQRRIGRRWAIGINILGNAALFGITAATDAVWPIVLAVILGEIGGPGWAIATNTWQHRNIPEHLRGRVASSYRVLGFGAKAIGAALGGVIADRFGIPALYGICTVATLVTVVPFLRHVTEAAMARGSTGSPVRRT